MSQAQKLRPSPALVDAIREIRRRVGENTTAFAKRIGVTHGQVSRYESGTASPGLYPLMQLLELAEGTEKNPILAALAQLLPVKGGVLAESALRSEFRMLGFSVPEGASHPLEHPNLRELVSNVQELCKRGREIDSSLTRIVRLWAIVEESEMKPEIRAAFEKAAQFLEVEAAAAAAARRSARKDARKRA